MIHFFITFNTPSLTPPPARDLATPPSYNCSSSSEQLQLHSSKEIIRQESASTDFRLTPRPEKVLFVFLVGAREEGGVLVEMKGGGVQRTHGSIHT